jgi:hypothetical protein
MAAPQARLRNRGDRGVRANVADQEEEIVRPENDAQKSVLSRILAFSWKLLKWIGLFYYTCCTIYYLYNPLLDVASASAEYATVLQRLKDENRLAFTRNWAFWPIVHDDAFVDTPNLDVQPLQQIYNDANNLVNFTLGYSTAALTLQPLQEELANRLANAKKNSSYCSTAYPFSSFLQGNDSKSVKRMSIRDSSLRFRDGRIFFPMEHSDQIWNLLTSIHTVWEDPQDDDTALLRAFAPWGDLFCWRDSLNSIICQSQLARVIKTPEGPCTHFDLWATNVTGHSLLGSINRPNWHARYFAIHMRERIMYDIYTYAWNIVQAADLGQKLNKLSTSIPGRTRDTYKLAALHLFEIYLKSCTYCGAEESWRDVYSDNLEAPKDLRSIVTREFELNKWMQLDRRQLELNEQQYQALLAVKLYKLTFKASIYDNRFYHFRFWEGTIWIG